MKKIYSTPKVIEIKLDNAISLQLQSPPTSNPRENIGARGNISQDFGSTEENPYQYENW